MKDQETRDREAWEQVEDATELVQEERFIEALIALRSVIKANPENHYAFHFLGVSLFESGEREAARDAYRAAIRLAPDYLGARVGLSNTLRHLGDADGALREAKEALRKFPKDGEAMQAAGLAYAMKGQRKNARVELEGYLRTSPDVEAQLEVKQVLEMLGLGEEGDPFEIE